MVTEQKRLPVPPRHVGSSRARRRPEIDRETRARICLLRLLKVCFAYLRSARPHVSSKDLTEWPSSWSNEMKIGANRPMPRLKLFPVPPGVELGREAVPPSLRPARQNLKSSFIYKSNAYSEAPKHPKPLSFPALHFDEGLIFYDPKGPLSISPSHP